MGNYFDDSVTKYVLQQVSTKSLYRAVVDFRVHSVLKLILNKSVFNLASVSPNVRRFLKSAW